MKTDRAPIYLAHLSWERFRDLVPERTDLAIVPVGTMEAHGAMALGTDTLIPESLAAVLAPRFGAVIAPAVAYGVTDSLLPYPGSTTVTSATFKAYLFEAAAGLVDAGFRRIVLLNGHGGQSAEVASVVSRLWSDKRAFAVALEWWGVAEAVAAAKAIYGEHPTGHAGTEETAMVLAVRPDLVDRKRARSIRRAHRRAGVRARPFPASIILDRPETKGDGAPDLDPKKAKRFFERCAAAAADALEEVFAGWKDLERR